MAKATSTKSKKRTTEATSSEADATELLAPAEAPHVDDDSGARYSWALLAGRVAPATEEDLQLFSLRRPGDLLRLDGREVSSEKILSDGRVWLGLIVDFADLGNEAIARVFGFRLGLLRSFHTELSRLRMLVARREANRDGGDAQTLAVGLANDFAVALRPRYAQRRAALIAAASNDTSALGRVLALPPAEVADDKLPGAVRDLVALISAFIDRGDAVGSRTRIRGFSPADAEALGRLADGLEDAIELRDRPDGMGPVEQRTLDTQDGVCLALMEQLFDLFEGASGATAVPKLVPNATRGWFNRRAKLAREAALKYSGQ
ncbi:MAG: hypothetical protein JNK72_09425 [Myxococcales bacterium]|nr:hypothetical protein [Myxococcales bacterium]